MYLGKIKKIVLVLGNGFDLDLGLKTSYKDFWESECCPKTYPAPIIKHLNQRWADDISKVRWYDLENELLKYAVEASNSTECNDVISHKEKEFLQKINPKVPVRGYYTQYEDEIKSLIDKGLILFNDGGNNVYMTIPNLEDLINPVIWRDRKALDLIKIGLLMYLQEAWRDCKNEDVCSYNVLFAMMETMRKGNEVKIYNFNYTQLPDPYMTRFSDIMYYVHGSCRDEKIIIGTQDAHGLDVSYDYVQKSFDSNYNPPALVYDLLEADEIVIFGHSIGVNDRQYFKSFFQQQTSTIAPQKKKISIFTYDEKSEMEIKRSLQMMTDHNLSILYGLNEVKIIKTANIINDSDDYVDFMLDHINDKYLVYDNLRRMMN